MAKKRELEQGKISLDKVLQKEKQIGKKLWRKWNEGLKRLYPDYVESVEDRSVDDILGE